MEAGLGSNPSYIWRSLQWSKEVLVSGLLWRVGDGKKVRIFKDKWIPSMYSTLNESDIPWDRETTVRTLIRDGGWDTTLISNSFNPYVADEIFKIPIEAGVGDSVFWRYDAKGQYTVKDGCRLQRGLFSAPKNQSIYPNEDWWKFVWSLSIPQKIRIFWWSISHDGIPTNQNLLKHHVPVTEARNLCNYPKDSTCHALLFCPAIKHLWKDTSFAPAIRNASPFCTLEFCLWLKGQLSKSEFEDLSTHTWAIWKEKQNFLHGDKKELLPEHVSWSSAIMHDFRKTRDMVNILNAVPGGNSEKVWNPPPLNSLKINVDAAVNEDKRFFSIGGAVRNNQSRLLLAFGKQINQHLSVVHGELQAITEGINLLYEKGFTDVQIATYSIQAVQTVTTNEEDLGYTGFCVIDIRKRLTKPVISDFYHVHRSANVVAHNLARFAISSPSSFVWVNGDFPFLLVRLVMDGFH